jgi:sarcosine oxidase subunit beta
MRKSADIVIIGGGSIGCAIAYNLAKKGFENVVLLEKRYLTSGSTGRCAASMRMQWGTEMNCRLNKKSIRIFETLEEELGYDIEFEQDGYLLVTFEEEQAEQLEKNLEVQHKFDIPSKRLSKREAKDMVPYLNTDKLAGAFFCEDDAYACPFKTTMAYAKAAEKLGVEINTYTEVVDIEEEDGRVTKVITNQGEIATDNVINATGPYAKFIGEMLGLSHPVEPERHQILVTEPMERMVDPMVMSFHHNSYIQQVPHGGFLMGYGDFEEAKRVNYEHDWNFLEEMSRKAQEQIPMLKDVRVVRQWAGHYGISPDGQPILGGVPEVDGYYLALGCAKGFMLAPVIGLLMAEYLAGEETTIPIDRLDVKRFERGELIVEPAVV